MVEELCGVVDSIRFTNPENGYTILSLSVGALMTTVVGNFPAVTPGQKLLFRGSFVTHPRFGRQFKAEAFEFVKPHQTDEIEKYLSSGVIKGVGPSLAAAIVAQYGEDTLRVLDETPDALIAVSGIGRVKLAEIKNAWSEQKANQELMLFMAKHDISPSLAGKIIKMFGSKAIEKITTDPYQIATAVRGVGFLTADKIAKSVGIPKNSPARIRSAVIYKLREGLGDGHVFLPKSMLMDEIAELLEISVSEIEPVLSDMASDQTGRVEVRFDIVDADIEAIFLPEYFVHEVDVAERLIELSTFPDSRLTTNSLFSPAMFVDRGGLTDQQAAAVEIAFTHPVSIITGNPGTGKSFTIRTIIETVEKMGKRCALAAPTGRAAKRITETTGRYACTIHRLLNLGGDQHEDEDEDEDTFLSDPAEEEMLRFDLIVIDESSMLDIVLANRLLKHVPLGAHLILVGDIDQLPSVGAGNFLRDAIASGVVPVTRLTEIFRQSAESEIITNAHTINRGEMPVISNQKDFFLFNAENGAKATEWAVDLVKNRIPQKFGLAPADIQVLAPMYRGAAGVNELNARLQAVLNPPSKQKAERRFSEFRLFRVGDRVLVTKNNYEKEVFNGDIGTITDIDENQQTIYVSVDGKGVNYGFDEANQLVLAYAISCHKSQGSEYPAVVVVLQTEHFTMLARNLFYTAITRARKYCILVSNNKALRIAVSRNDIEKRFTSLRFRLQQALAARSVSIDEAAYF